MTDVLNPKQRSYNMSKIRRSHTKPELIIKDYLEKIGFEHQKDYYGKPDFINFKNKTVIFIDGCFWHMCPKCFKMPKSNRLFWKNKLLKNTLRDKEITLNYQYSDWKVIRIWEHTIKSSKYLQFINKLILLMR